MPYLVPYGGISWTVSCLLPPSSISLFATVLLKMEVRAPAWIWHAMLAFHGPPHNHVHMRRASPWQCQIALVVALMCIFHLPTQVAQQGLTWGALGQSITPDFPFSGRGVFLMVTADIFIYALLTAYLDHVRSSVTR
jgi:hypothetical protein